MSAKPRTTEDQLREANAFLDAIVENIPDMIFVKRAEDHMFVRFNRAGEELLGWSRQELLGKTDHDFYPKEQADFFHAKDRETLRNKVLVDVPEEPIQTRHKGLRWLHTKKVPVLDHRGEPVFLLGISEDITERKAMEERTHALERELAGVVRNAREAIVTWGDDGTIVSFNPAAEELYGVRAEEAIGSSIERIVPDAARPAFRAAMRRLRDGERVPFAEVERLRGGDEIEVEESLFLIPGGSDRTPRVGSIAREVGELNRLRRAAEILGGTSAAGARQEARSAAMRAALAAADAAAHDPKATVLLLGETGVGKGWLARRIHATSVRAGKPFFEVNCASLGPQLVESELFGHERGAFTGAVAQKRGLVEVAEGGTLFLDEIGELPPAVQAQVLTFLDDRSFRRVGGVRTQKADVRILAATNVDLKVASEAGRFRKDLYYRLSVFPIVVPPLRERREDLADLAGEILSTLERAGARRAKALDRTVVKAIERYDWPGNVRELKNALERALILSRGGPVRPEHLPPEIAQRASPAAKESMRLDEVERQHIERVLARVDQNRTRAAEMLGISRSTLKRKLAEEG